MLEGVEELEFGSVEDTRLSFAWDGGGPFAATVDGGRWADEAGADAREKK